MLSAATSTAAMAAPTTDSDDHDSMPSLSPMKSRRNGTSMRVEGADPVCVVPISSSSAATAAVVAGVKRKLRMDDSSVMSAPTMVTPLPSSASSSSSNTNLIRSSSSSHHSRSHHSSHSHKSHSSSSSSSSKRRRLGESEKRRFFADFEQLDAMITDENETMQQVPKQNEEMKGMEMDEDKGTATASHHGFSFVLDRTPTLLPPLESIVPSLHSNLVATAVCLPPFPPPVIAASPPLHPDLPRAKTALPRASSPPNRLRVPTVRSLPASPSKLHASVSTPAAATPPPTSAGLFDGMRIILLQGPQLTSKRCELLTAQVNKRGGKIVAVEDTVSSAAAASAAASSSASVLPLKHVTHVLFGNTGGSDPDGRVKEFAEKVKRELSNKASRSTASSSSVATFSAAYEAIRFLSVEWLTSCLRKNRLSRYDKHEWRPFVPSSTSSMSHHVDFNAPSLSDISSYADPHANLMLGEEHANAVMFYSPPIVYAQDQQQLYHPNHKVAPISYQGSSSSFETSIPNTYTFAQGPFDPTGFNSAQSMIQLPSASAASSHLPSSSNKRDIVYVMEAMNGKERLPNSTSLTSSMPFANQHQEQQHELHDPTIKLEGTFTPSPPATSVTVKIEKIEPGAQLDISVLQRMKREAKKEKMMKKEQMIEEWKMRKAEKAEKEKNGEITSSTSTSASSSSSAILLHQPLAHPAAATVEMALAQSYLQSVPTFRTANDIALYQSSKKPTMTFMSNQQFPSSSVSAASAPPASVAVTSKSTSHPLPTHQSSASSYIDRTKAHLACQIFSSQHQNHNAHITSFLEKLENMNSSIGDKWRTYAYRKANGIIKKYPKKITTQDDLLELTKIRGLGSKILAKISEILETGQLEKVKKMEANEQIQAMALFSSIHGVGSATATKWYTWGLRRLDQLLTDPRVELNSVQEVGLQFRDDKLVRIPRLEVTSILDYVHRAANRILPGVTVICCGSYRRGAPTSGDVDLLFTHPTFTTKNLPNDLDDHESIEQREAFLKKLLLALHEDVIEGSERWKEEERWTHIKYEKVKEEWERSKREREKKVGGGDFSAAAASSSSSSTNMRYLAPPLPFVRSSNPRLRPPDAKCFLTGDLNTFEKLSSRHGQAYYMGFCSLPRFHPFFSGLHRRIDMKVYPAAHFPYALLYFTGSDHFNRSMRFFAKKKMWTLSDHGLCPAIRVNGTKVWSGKSVYCATEKDIFDALGLMYVPPEQRNVYAHFELSEEEKRIEKHNHRAKLQEGQADVDYSYMSFDQHAIAPSSAAAAATSSSSSSSSHITDEVVLNPLGFPLKQEVKLELAEMDEVQRATLGLRRLIEEEAEIIRNRERAWAQGEMIKSEKQV